MGRHTLLFMGISAARYHRAIPRALSNAVVAAPKQRPALETVAGRIIFVKRDVSVLDIERMETTLGQGRVTTVEQTLVDLAARPSLGELAQSDVVSTIRSLANRSDWATVERLAAEQHKPRALAYARRSMGNDDA